MIRVDLVDPPAYSPPYDHALAVALARAGASVSLLTSEFAYGSVPTPDGYRRSERFYRPAVGAPGSRLRPFIRAAQHAPGMVAYARSVSGDSVDVAHFQWLTVPELDLRLLPRSVPTVLTIHDPLRRARARARGAGGRRGGRPGRRGGRPGSRPRLGASAFARLSAIVVHSEYARAAVIAAHGLDPERVHVIRHGALPAPGALPGELEGPGALPGELEGPGDRPVVLSFGLIRPYKGLETLLSAWRQVDDAELWIVGRPMADLNRLRASAPAGVRWVTRFVSDAEQAAVFARADIVVLPYERSERFGFSGVLATALGLGKTIVLSDIGGFREVGELGAARLVAPGERDALADALSALIADPQERARLGDAARVAAAGTFSWEAAARATLELYERIAA